MQTFTYPQSDLDRGRTLLSVLGSYWADTFQAKDQMASYVQAIAEGAKQNQLNLLETVAALSRFDIPVFHTENWYPITLHKKQLNATAANIYKFDQNNITFDNDGAAVFDGVALTDFYAFPVATDLVDAGHIFDRLLFPTVDLISGVDFKIDRANSAILFTRNPFDIVTIPRTPVYGANNALVDEVIILWAFRANLDYQYVFRQFSYAINVQLESSENAKKLVNAIFDGLVAGGATVKVLNAALSAIFDIPLVLENGEIVEAMANDRRGAFIATNKHVYRCPAGTTPVVAVDQVLMAGDKLVDTFSVIELSRGELPDDFAALALDKNFTTACFYGDLIFENKEVPLRVNSAHPSNYTYVDFELSGFPADVEQFFAEVHARGIKSIAPPPDVCTVPDAEKYGTLAHLLDQRKTPEGEPTAEDLPATINPLQFLVKNVLRNHVIIVTVKIAGLGENHLNLYNIRHIRQLLPPYAGMFIVYTLDGIREVIAGESALVEDLSLFKGINPVVERIPVQLVRDKGVIIRSISGTCE
jgi:hypothetical protein